MITANTQPVQPAPPVPPPAACPCGFPIRRIYAGELICLSCGRRETLAGEFWARIVAAMVGGGRRMKAEG